jgi:hypothetical protein
MSLVGWFGGDRNTGYTTRAFDSPYGNRNLFPRFDANNSSATWDPLPISTRSVNGRQRYYDIIGATNNIATDWRWANSSLNKLVGAIDEIGKILVEIEKVKKSYPNF